MRVHKAFVLLALAALVVFGTAAQDEGVKIGIVDIEQALASTDAGKAAQEEMTRKAREAEASFQPMIERYREMEEDFKAKKFVLSEEALYQKQLDLQEMAMQVQSKKKELESQMQVEMQRINGPLLSKFGEIVEELGRDQGFTLILHRQTPGVLYTREALDITDQIVAKYNSKG